MIAIDSANPLTWSYPKNKRSTSCYIDSALWAILYKRNNGIYNLINKFDTTNFNTNISTCTTENLKIIQKNLISFYDNILQNSDLSNYVTNILNKFTECNITTNNDKWLSGQQDASQVLTQISKIFEVPDSIGNINFIATRNYVKPDGIKFDKVTPKQYQSMVIITCTTENPEKIPTKKDFTDDSDTINLYNLKNYTMTDAKTLNITGEIEKWIPSNGDVEDNSGIKQKVKSQQLNYTYSTEDNSPIDSIILNISRFYHHGSKKTNYNVNFPFKIGNLVLSSIIVHDGRTIEYGHYICYFRVGNDWFLMNDSQGIKKIENIIEEKNISSGCSILVYFLEISSIVNDTPSDFFCDLFFNKSGKYPERILVDDQKVQEKLSSGQHLTISSKSSFNTMTNPQQYVNINTGKKLVVYNTCDQAGQDWLDLFTNKNTGLIQGQIQQKQRQIFMPSDIGKITRTKDLTGKTIEEVVILKSCPDPDAIEPDASAINSEKIPDEAPAVVATSPVVVAAATSPVDPLIGKYYINKTSKVSPIKTDNLENAKLRIDDTSDYFGPFDTQEAAEEKIKEMEEEKKRINQEENEKKLKQAQERLEAAKKDATLVQPLNETTIPDNTPVYVIQKNQNGMYSDPVQKILKIISSVITICNKKGDVCVNLKGDQKFFFTDLKNAEKYAEFLNSGLTKGGTRKRRNRNIKFKTRKIKGKGNLINTNIDRNGKRTRKHIRSKNKSKTNKLRKA